MTRRRHSSTQVITPQKMFVPSHHLSRDGFEFDFATGAGKPIALEEWTIAEAWRYEDVIKAMRDSVMV